MNDLAYEKDHLASALEKINEVILDEQNDVNILTKEAKGNDDKWQQIYDKEYKIKILTNSLETPYFARIDFQRDDENSKKEFYIGRRGVSKDGEIIVTDWRAPISSLYYDKEVGKCDFEAPEGTVKGDMLLKRQFEIEQGKLFNYFDVDLVNGDSLLQKYLNENNDNRLKSIVATIQKEQNDVIRRKINENIIVQGVAGSGKTTVALHKIAYLVYNYSKTINEDKFLVIGPNPVFLKYIRTVLPDLDVSGVRQLTFEEFAKEYTNENINISNSEEKAALNILGKNIYDIDKFKCSIKYKYMLEEYLKNFTNSLTQDDLKLGDFTVLNNHIIKKVFDSIDSNYSLDIRVEQTINRLSKYIKDNYSWILNSYTDYSDNLYQISDNKEELRKLFNKDREEIKKYCKSAIRRYFTKSKVNATGLYKRFIESINDYNLFNYENIDILKRETLKNIRNKTYDFEDLSALIYLKKALSMDKKYQKYRHVVIDEAQDFGEFNYAILKEVFEGSTFSIFGDLAQSIYDYRSIDNWDKVNSIMFNNTAELVLFKKSYRTTRQIMNIADRVAESINLNKSDLVLREGPPVTFTKPNNKIEYIGNKIKALKSKGYKTIAVISKTDEISKKLNNELKQSGIDIPNITLEDDLTDNKYNICTISNQLAKGLEFDAVIINGADESIYNSNSTLDMKLLYVAITRALHELDIIYQTKLTNPLNNVN